MRFLLALAATLAGLALAVTSATDTGYLLGGFLTVLPLPMWLAASEAAIRPTGRPYRRKGGPL